jgi:hypothetical protein
MLRTASFNWTSSAIKLLLQSSFRRHNWLWQLWNLNTELSAQIWNHEKFIFPIPTFEYFLFSPARFKKCGHFTCHLVRLAKSDYKSYRALSIPKFHKFQTLWLIGRLVIQWSWSSGCLLSCCIIHAGFSLHLFFKPEDGGDMFLRTIGWLSANYLALYLRKQNS